MEERPAAVGALQWPPIAQLAEAIDLKSTQSGFESLWGDERQPFGRQHAVRLCRRLRHVSVHSALWRRAIHGPHVSSGSRSTRCTQSRGPHRPRPFVAHGSSLEILAAVSTGAVSVPGRAACRLPTGRSCSRERGTREQSHQVTMGDQGGRCGARPYRALGTLTCGRALRPNERQGRVDTVEASLPAGEQIGAGAGAQVTPPPARRAAV